MNKLDVKQLPIMNVTQRVSGPILTIHFEIDAYRYYLYILKDSNQNNFRIQTVFHDDQEVKENICSICSNHDYWCDELAKHKEELFQRLITFPSIRLYWLYV